MQVTVETGEGLARQIKVELPQQDVEQEIDKRLRDVARSARLPGFRPGKVPMRVLRQRFGESVRGEVFGEMVQSSFSEAITNEELRPAGMPEIEADIDQAAGRYAYTAKFEVLPQIELQGLAGTQIKRPVVDLGDSDLDAMVERLREQRKTWSEVERAAASGDRVTISFEATIDGESFPGSSVEDRPLELGSGQMLPGFEDQLIGAQADTEREVYITFPEADFANELSGKRACFNVSVKAVAEPVLPEVDAEFVRGFGIDDGDIDRFRAEIRKNMERELKQRVDAAMKNQVLDALMEANPVDLPAVLISEEIKALKGQMGQVAASSGSEVPEELYAESAKRRVALGLIVAEVVKQHELKPDADRVRAAVEEMAATYEAPQDVIDYYYADRQRMASVESMVMEEMVVKRMLDEANVEDEPTTFAALTDSSDGA
ncbi:MAG: trigger factor [Thiohalocapsa sp.]